MGVKISVNGQVMNALLEGEIDHHTAKSMREEIDFEVNKMQPALLNLDFGNIQFMDSSGIGLIMGRYKMMKSMGGALKVVNVSSQMDRVIRLSGLGALGVIERKER